MQSIMSNVKNSIIEQAVRQANRSTYYQKIGAVIFNKKRVISKGYNQIRASRRLHPKFQEWPGSVHAEVAAILNARTGLKNCDILVVRVNNQNQFRLAKPCKYCQMYLEYVGIKKIYYSIDHYPYIERLN